MKLFGPRLRITKNGLKIQPPRARIGGKVGLNISKSGVSGSVRTRSGSFSTKRGITLATSRRKAAKSAAGCLIPIVLSLLLVLSIVLWLN
jgi:hypothetical protein